MKTIILSLFFLCLVLSSKKAKFSKSLKLDDSKSPFKEVEALYKKKQNETTKNIFFKELIGDQKSSNETLKESCYVNRKFQCEFCCLGNRQCGNQGQCEDYR